MIDSQPPSGGGQLAEIPFLRLPQPEVLFARRVERFAALAPAHTLSEYLEFLARIARAQEVAAVTLAGRRPTWPEALRVVQTELSAVDMPAESRAALDRLGGATPDELQGIAERVRANAVEGSDLAAGPFVAAALQVEHVARAAQVDAAAVERRIEACPICDSLPVAGIVLGDDRVRYLVCSLCATQWHRTRLQCAACGEAKDLGYYGLEGERAASVPSARAVKAEACPSCKAYTKLFYVEEDPRLEPFADDVATLALDLLMAENGWVRFGVNLFLLPAAEPGHST